MSFPIDPNLLGVPPIPGAMPPAPVPNPDPMAMAAAQPVPGMGPPAAPLGSNPFSPVPVAPGPPSMGLDPILTQLMQQPRVSVDPEMLIPPNKRPGWFPRPDIGEMREMAMADKEYYSHLINRFARDLTLYRQKHVPNVPPGFHPLQEVAFRVATISNVVNKLANMMSAGDWRHVVPFKDEKSKENSQIVENWYSYLRQCEEENYAISGGDASLQFDESWYLLQYGRVVCRILPDPTDPNHPYNEAVLDPSTCFPTFGDAKEGMIRMTRIYESKVSNIIKTYGMWNLKQGMDINANMLDALGVSSYEDLGRYYHETGEVVEYWDQWHRGVTFRGVTVMEDSHNLGYVPFIYVIARGEPRSVVTPEGHGYYQIDEYNNVVGLHTREDLSEKGVSVFHHIINTNRMAEIVYTLLLSEVLKSQNPAYITYSVPQMAGQLPPPIGTYPGAHNQRILNAQKVEVIPTSPRPTDTSPVLNKVQADTTEGTINPAMYGSMDGSNIAGFAVESLISAARDTILPYTQGFERYQALKAKMKAKQYVRNIAPTGYTMTVAMEGKYGSSPSADITADIIRSTGFKVEVEMIGVSDSVLPAMINMASQAVKEGIKSRRWAMEKTGDKDPDKMFRDIITERAIEHPEIMENVIIPQIFIKNGQQDLAYMWGFMVVLPKLMQTMGGLMGGAMPPGMGGPPGIPGMGGPPPPTGPQPNGQSNPLAGIQPGPPTGPLPGQGRQ